MFERAGVLAAVGGQPRQRPLTVALELKGGGAVGQLVITRGGVASLLERVLTLAVVVAGVGGDLPLDLLEDAAGVGDPDGELAKLPGETGRVGGLAGELAFLGEQPLVGLGALACGPLVEQPLVVAFGVAQALLGVVEALLGVGVLGLVALQDRAVMLDVLGELLVALRELVDAVMRAGEQIFEVAPALALTADRSQPVQALGKQLNAVLFAF